MGGALRIESMFYFFQLRISGNIDSQHIGVSLKNCWYNIFGTKTLNSISIEVHRSLTFSLEVYSTPKKVSTFHLSNVECQVVGGNMLLIWSHSCKSLGSPGKQKPTSPCQPEVVTFSLFAVKDHHWLKGNGVVGSGFFSVSFPKNDSEKVRSMGF